MADLRSELLAVREQYGELTPANVVDAAREDDHPLHDRFEWDDEVAGEKYRLSQARQLIRVVKETYTDRAGRPADVRTFHAIPRPQGGMAYEPLDEVVKDDIASQILLRTMEREWRSLKARYERFDEFRALVLGDLGQDAAQAVMAELGAARHGQSWRGIARRGRHGWAGPV